MGGRVISAVLQHGHVCLLGKKIPDVLETARSLYSNTREIKERVATRNWLLCPYRARNKLSGPKIISSTIQPPRAIECARAGTKRSDRASFALRLRICKKNKIGPAGNKAGEERLSRRSLLPWSSRQRRNALQFARNLLQHLGPRR